MRRKITFVVVLLMKGIGRAVENLVDFMKLDKMQVGEYQGH